jgi:nicotinamidase-related amidase
LTLPADVAREIYPERTALLLIDMQRRHLDLTQGYHMLSADRAQLVVARAAVALDAARGAGLRVVHVGTWSRPASPWGPVEGRNPFWRWQTGRPIPGADFVRQSGKCFAGTVWAEFMPPVAPAETEPVVVKKKYSGFFATDLELVLRSLDIETLFIGGVNTNNCVLHTAFDAHARDLRVVVLEDACGSMNGQAYHEAAIRQIEAAIGWTAGVDDFTRLFARQSGASASSTAATTSEDGGRPGLASGRPTPTGAVPN